MNWLVFYYLNYEYNTDSFCISPKWIDPDGLTVVQIMKRQVRVLRYPVYNWCPSCTYTYVTLHMYIYSKKHKVGSTITSRRLCFFSLTTTRNVPVWTSLRAGSSWNNLRKVDILLANNNNKKCKIENKVWVNSSTWELPLADCASPQGHSAHCTTGVHMPSPAAEMKYTLIGTPSKTTWRIFSAKGGAG